jgi:hypothetical protein|tara:strand:+ start:240 stop:482 length:243 start_codon:yes stop_codon:yes gene_type:complete
MPSVVVDRFTVLAWRRKGQAGAGSLVHGAVIEAIISLIILGFLLLGLALRRGCLGGIHLAERWIHLFLLIYGEDLAQKQV